MMLLKTYDYVRNFQPREVLFNNVKSLVAHIMVFSQFSMHLS